MFCVMFWLVVIAIVAALILGGKAISKNPEMAGKLAEAAGKRILARWGTP
jgi:hypothetical protein